MQEILPVIAFIAAYLAAKWSGHSEQAIYWATAVLMISTVLQSSCCACDKSPSANNTG